jgi:hypothetical protein
MMSDDDPSGISTFDSETVKYKGRAAHSRQLYDEVLDRLSEYEADTGKQADTLILGRQTAVAIDAWLRYEGGDGVKAEIPVDTIATVPGRMIHVAQEMDSALADGAREGGRR